MNIFFILFGAVCCLPSSVVYQHQGIFDPSQISKLWHECRLIVNTTPLIKEFYRNLDSRRNPKWQKFHNIG